MLIVTETWLYECTDSCDFLPPKYEPYGKDCGSRGGGVAVIYKRAIVCSVRYSLPEIECVVCEMILDGSRLTFLAVYGPADSSDKYMLGLSYFLQIEFENSERNVVIAGELNRPYIDLSEYKEAKVDVITRTPGRGFLAQLRSSCSRAHTVT